MILSDLDMLVWLNLDINSHSLPVLIDDSDKVKPVTWANKLPVQHPDDDVVQKTVNKKRGRIYYFAS
jgi:hypothetical protein